MKNKIYLSNIIINSNIELLNKKIINEYINNNIYLLNIIITNEYL